MGGSVKRRGETKFPKVEGGTEGREIKIFGKIAGGTNLSGHWILRVD